jgi:hypothetical protein
MVLLALVYSRLDSVLVVLQVSQGISSQKTDQLAEIIIKGVDIMSNQTIIWASLVLAWVSILFLKKEELRRYMPAGLFSSLAFAFIFEAGISLQWWAVTESSFPLINIPLFIYGPYLIAPIWIFKYTYGRFWLYLVSNIVLDFALIFFLIDWFIQRGVWEAYISYFQVLMITTGLSVLIYGYQIWQSGGTLFETSPSVQPAACKPLNEDLSDKPDDQ